jgi:UDP-N-acetylmuramate dehydrogenase
MEDWRGDPRKAKMKVLKEISGLEVFQQEPMSRHTTLKIGGPVSTYLSVFSVEALQKLIRFFKEEGITYMVIGGGSNIVWTDEPLEITVLELSGLRHIKILERKTNNGEVTVLAGAGLPLLGLVRFAVKEGLEGLEGLSGIPGTVGGAIKGNAGAFGYEIKDTLYSVKILDKEGELKEVRREELLFGYRSSSLKDEEIIVEALFKLREGSRESLTRVMRDYIKKKAQRQPLNLPSAGCVFKNPPGDFAGRLIDEAGCKGMRSGDMEVSTIHANFIVNRGKGTQRDFLNLLEAVQERVMKRFQIMLEPEVKIIRSER